MLLKPSLAFTTYAVAVPVLAQGRQNIFSTHRRTAELPTGLAEKLDHQFAKYDSGRDYLIQKVVTEDSSVGRDEWEAFLTPDEGFALDDQDVADLRAYHEELIAEAAATAKSNSVISIDDFRNDTEQVQEFCRDFPRAALLHIHPSGTLKQNTITYLFNEINPIVDSNALIEIGQGDLTMLYPLEIEWLQTLESGKRYLEYDTEDQQKIFDLMFLPEDPCCHDFARFESLFQIHRLFLFQNETLTTYMTYKDFMERNEDYGISYVEFTKVLWPPTYEQTTEYIDLVAASANEHGFDHWNFNTAYVRTAADDVLKDLAQDFIQAKKDNVMERNVGIDLLAEETGNSALVKGQHIYVPIWDAWNKSEIDLGGITMHAGEHGPMGSNNVRDGIIMGVTRIGHGPQIIEDPLALEYQVRQKVPMVMNIVSNWLLNVIENDDLENHPFIEFLRLGIPISLSTDDEGMFNTDIVKECVTAIESSDIQYSELKQISYTSVTASFASDSLKATLLEELDSEFAAFEVTWTEDDGGDGANSNMGIKLIGVIIPLLFGILSLW